MPVLGVILAGAGEVLPTWDQALDGITGDEPVHVAQFGDRFDAQGVLSGSKDVARSDRSAEATHRKVLESEARDLWQDTGRLRNLRRLE